MSGDKKEGFWYCVGYFLAAFIVLALTLIGVVCVVKLLAWLIFM